MLQALLDADFSVTVLTRPSSKSTYPASVKVATVDYDDAESLKSTLKGQDAFISTLSTAAVAQQSRLIDAAIAAGVQRIIPSEFGCDLSNPKARQLPVYRQKVQIEDELEQKVKGTQTTYTLVFNNAFLDWALDRSFLIDVKGKKVEIYDGGNNPFTSTPLSEVAKGTVAVLKHPEETANKGVRLYGISLTQNKLLGIAQRVVGKDGWQITEESTAELEKQSYAALEKDPGNVHGWLVGFVKRAIFSPGFGGDFSSNNDNELLGLKELSEKDVEEYVRRSVA